MTSDDPSFLTRVSGAARVSGLGVIRAAGADAATFLHGQLTQNVLSLKPGESRLAAWCSAKGRMLASLWVHRRTDDELLLVISQDLLAQTLKRLSLFLLRAKVKLTDASAEFAVYGLLGDAARAPGIAGDVVIPLPLADGATRALLLTPPDAAPDAPSLAPDIWPWTEVRGGVVSLTAPVAEAFVPQMLNYESVGGVDFKKGCYPGQEVVARSQFRGTVKRRAWVARVDATAQAGQEIFLGSDPAQPVGQVAQAAPEPASLRHPTTGTTSGYALIACLSTAAVQAVEQAQGRLTLGSPDGPALADLHQPYLLLEDV